MTGGEQARTISTVQAGFGAVSPQLGRSKCGGFEPADLVTGAMTGQGEPVMAGTRLDKTGHDGLGGAREFAPVTEQVV
jgi:hypothetical protein